MRRRDRWRYPAGKAATVSRTSRRLTLIAAGVVLAAAAVVIAFAVRSSDGDPSSSAVARCTRRMFDASDIERFRGFPRGSARRYVTRVYCKPFAERGWLHPDGTFKLAAYTESGSSACAEGVPAGEPARTIPCTELEDPVILDCGFLRFVPRGEVRRYVARLERTATVRCDDGTPPFKVGA